MDSALANGGRFAVVTMDIEDWYHTGYLKGDDCDRTFSILNTIDWFCDCLEASGARATLFVLGELVPKIANKLNTLAARGHEIASHAWSHTPPMQMTKAQFAEELRKCQRVHRDYLAFPLEGFRAPLFSLDRARLEQVMEAGFQYDSSSTARGRRKAPLQIADFAKIRKQIFHLDDFYEFQVGAPGFGSYFINGGGGTRLLPWPITQRLLNDFLMQNDFYNFYVHPLDISTQEIPLPGSLSRLSRARMLNGRGRMMSKLERILHILNVANFKFTTFSELRGGLGASALLRESLQVSSK